MQEFLGAALDELRDCIVTVRHGSGWVTIEARELDGEPEGENTDYRVLYDGSRDPARLGREAALRLRRRL